MSDDIGPREERVYLAVAGISALVVLTVAALTHGMDGAILGASMAAIGALAGASAALLRTRSR